jgi:prevent-host-death family protein
MAKTVNMHEAKTQLSRLVKEAAAGEEIVIAKAGDPVARLVAYEKPRGRRKPGGWDGRVWMAPDFDELPPDIAEAFGMHEKD